jgi:hypothetical protein
VGFIGPTNLQKEEEKEKEWGRGNYSMPIIPAKEQAEKTIMIYQNTPMTPTK